MIRAFIISTLCISCLCGCATIGKLRQAFVSDPTVSGEQKLEYMTKLEDAQTAIAEMKQTYKQFSVFQYAAVGMIICGVALVIFNKTNTRVGVAVVATGLGCSAWGIIAPNNVRLLTIIMCVGVLLCGLYLAQGFFKKGASDGR